MARIIPVLSPKEGAGKTFICLHLAHVLASKGYGVCLLATGWQLKQQAPWFDKRAPGDLKKVLAGRIKVDEVIGLHSSGIKVLADSNGLKQDNQKTSGGLRTISEILAGIKGCDYLIVDPPAGVSQRAIAFSLAVEEAVLVLTLDSQCLTAAFDLLRALSANGFKGIVKTVFNKVGNMSMARNAFEKFQDSARRYLDLDLELLAFVKFDSKAEQAHENKKMLTSAGSSRAYRDIQSMAMAIDEEVPTDRQALPVDKFLEGFTKNLRSLIPLPVKTVKQQPARSGSSRVSRPGKTPAPQTETGKPGTDPLERIALALENLAREAQLLRRDLGQGRKEQLGGGGLRFHEPLRLDWEEFIRQRSQRS